MITEIETQIIEKLRNGMSPAQISIEYEKSGLNIAASYIRYIKMTVDADCVELLDSDESDINNKMASIATTSRQYEKMKTAQ
jgi:hypothetical protein